MNTDLEERPDPDMLLASLKLEEEKSKRGKLRMFFGMCAGVGKTYSMLQTAQAEKLKGYDIVIGYVETHNRKETSALVDGFEVIPRKTFPYKSTFVEELDLDAILARKPKIVIIDELAHSNVIGSRHAKRYLDVLEILENGIDVYTTLNVQHLESRSDTVAQITGVVVRETLPDEIFENADDVELVDITPKELLQRFIEGKVYTAERSKEAVANFFREENITALREMALRLVADRVDKQLYDYMQYNSIKGTWKLKWHFLVAVDHTKQSEQLLRWAKNLSYTTGSDLQAIYVESLGELNPEQKEQLDKNVNLIKQFGLKYRIITHNDAVKAIVDFAKKENITHILVGKPHIPNVFILLRHSNFINKLIRYSGEMDVYVFGSEKHTKNKFRMKFSLAFLSAHIRQYVVSSMVIILVSTIFFLFKDFVGYQVVSFVLLFVVSILAFFYGTGPILLASTLSALIWDYCFLPPAYTLHVDKMEDILMLVMFFIIALLNGVLTSVIRKQEKRIRLREEHTNALYLLTKEFSYINDIDKIMDISQKYIMKYFSFESFILLKDNAEQLNFSLLNAMNMPLSDNDKSVATWTFQHASKAGKFTDTLPSSPFTFYPLKGNQINLGVVGVKQSKGLSQNQEPFWESLLTQISSKFERESLRNIAKQAYLLNESEKLYKTLFNSISHELRIPVSTILGASDTLLMQTYPVEIQQQLLSEINIASVRLNRLIENLLNMSRLESGRISPRFDWCDVHDIANKVAEMLKQELQCFDFSVVIPENIPLVKLDFGLTEQILYNIILNATQNASGNTTIRLKFIYDQGFLIIQVMDRGIGFPVSELETIFNKFYRGKNAKTGGTGLGLSIVKGFVEAQNGTVNVQNRKNGGAIFTVSIPVEISDINQFERNE